MLSGGPSSLLHLPRCRRSLSQPPACMAANARHRNRVTQRGFTACENALLFDKTLSPGALRLLLALKHYAWKNDGEIPTQAEIANAIGVSERAVRDDFKELEARGRIKVERRQGTRAVVYIEDPSAPEESAGDPGPVATPAPEETAGEQRQDLPVDTLPLTRGRDEDLQDEGANAPSGVGPTSVYQALLRAIYPEGSKLTRAENRKVVLAAQNIETGGGKAEDVPRAVAAWPKLFKTAAITAWAVSSHWTRLLAESTGSKPAAAAPAPLPERCAECDLGGGRHAADCPLAPDPAPNVLADLFRQAHEGA